MTENVVTPGRSQDAGYVTTPDAGLSAYADQFLEDVASIPEQRPTLGAIIPAYNEAETIAGVLDSLLMQTRLPDVIHVIINNTSDDSVEIAGHYAGPHTRVTPLGEQNTVVYVHDIGKNPDKKVGALNYGYSLVETMDYLLGVDGDTTPGARRHRAPLQRDRQRRPDRRDLGDLHHRRQRPRQPDRQVVDHRPTRPVLGLQHAEPAQGSQHGRARWAVLDLLHPGAA